MLATCVLHLLGYNRFSSGFNFPLSPSPSVPCKNREKPHSCVFSPKKVFHTLIKSAPKDILGYPYGNALLAWLSWKWEKQRHLEVEDRQQSTLNHLIAGEFPPCYLDHSALVGRRHVTCSLCLLESWVKCCSN